MAHGGDDLDDDFVADDLINDLPAAEELPVDVGAENVYVDPSNPSYPLDTTASIATEDAAKQRKKRAREKEKERRVKKRKLLERSESDCPLAAQLPARQAEYLTSTQLKTFPKMSTIELSDLQIPENCIVDTTKWEGSRSLEQLPDFIISVLPTLHKRLSQKSKANGSPTLLYIAGAALRVADVTRVLKDKRLRGEKGGEVAKLFAKHFKLADHVAYLKRTKVGAAVGTPGRIGKLLLETDALTISALSHIILDVTFRDAKNRTLLDIPETRTELFKEVLGGPEVLKSINEGKIQVVLF